jgi:tol-pal system protein YbgF
VKRSRRSDRILRGALPLLLAVLATGCATKRDIRDMRSDLRRLEARQDTIYQLLQSQNREILDSLQVTTDRLLNVRGELANQLQQLQDQLVQVGELTGQVQIRLNQLDQELVSAVRDVRGGGGGGGGAGGPPSGGAASGGRGGGGGGGAGDFSMVEEYYQIGLEQIDRGNAATARQAFQLVVDSFPDHPSAPEAQRQIGETYAMEQDYDLALQAFDRVVQRYQDSEAAPRALFRAGVISQERGNIERARQYFQRVIAGYPSSDARRLAEDALSRLQG